MSCCREILGEGVVDVSPKDNDGINGVYCALEQLAWVVVVSHQDGGSVPTYGWRWSCGERHGSLRFAWLLA